MPKLTQQQYWELKSDFHIDESIHKDLPSTKKMVMIYLGITMLSLLVLFIVAYFTQSEFFYEGLRHVSTVLLVSLIPFVIMMRYLRKGQIKMRQNKAIIALSSMTWDRWDEKSELEQEELLYELKSDIYSQLSYSSSMSTTLVFFILIPQFYVDGEGFTLRSVLIGLSLVLLVFVGFYFLNVFLTKSYQRKIQKLIDG